MTGFNTQLSAECISLLNLVMALSSLVQFKLYLCNQVDDCAGNEVSQHKVAAFLLQSVFFENSPVVLPVNLQLADGLPPQVGLIDLACFKHSLHATGPGSTFKLSTFTFFTLLSICQYSDKCLVYHTDAPVFQSHGTASCLQDLRPSLCNCASAEYQMTGSNP